MLSKPAGSQTVTAVRNPKSPVKQWSLVSRPTKWDREIFQNCNIGSKSTMMFAFHHPAWNQSIARPKPLTCAEMRSVALILVPSIVSAENQHDSPLKALLLCSASLITLIEWTPTWIISSSTDPQSKNNALKSSKIFPTGSGRNHCYLASAQESHFFRLVPYRLAPPVHSLEQLKPLESILALWR